MDRDYYNEMAIDVKRQTRRYDASRRRRRARARQRRTLDVAERLFLERGYGTTTVAEIARQADVSPQSIYATFGGKRGLLKRLMDVRVAGDEDALPLLERDWYRQMLSEPDPARLLRRHAASVREILERVAPLIVVLRDAAGADPALAADYHVETRERRYVSQRAVSDELARRGMLRAGLDPDAAADILWTLSSPDCYQALVAERGWAPARFERWLGDTLIATLLPGGVAPVSDETGRRPG